MGIELTPAAKDLLAKKGYDPVLGARPLRRTIQREIEDALSEKILYAEFASGQYVLVDTEGEGKEEKFTFSDMAHPDAAHRPGRRPPGASRGRGPRRGARGQHRGRPAGARRPGLPRRRAVRHGALTGTTADRARPTEGAGDTTSPAPSSSLPWRQRAYAGTPGRMRSAPDGLPRPPEVVVYRRAQ